MPSIFDSALPSRHSPFPETDPGAQAALSQPRACLIIALSLAVFFFHMYTAITGLWSATLQRSVHWLLVGTLLFVVSMPPRHKEHKIPAKIWDIACIAALIGASAYLIFYWEDMVCRVSPPCAAELFFGGALIIVTLEAARRTSGLFLPLTAAVFLLYAIAGPYMPGILKHKGYSISRIISYLYSTSSGIYGIPLAVSATYITLFVFFGAFLNASGASKLLLECSLALTGRFTGGAAKTAVVASALMGTMSGSSIANAVTTGSITIPLMRKSGFSKNAACAIEAVASTGGMIMPPVMGATAFIMAEYLRMDYAAVITAAFLPALVFFTSIYFTIDFYARKHRIGGSEVQRGKALQTIKTSWLLVLPIILLVALLLLRSPMTAVVWSLLAIIAVSSLRKETRLTPALCIEAIVEGAKNSVAVASACAASGIILGVIGLTGIGSSFSSAIFSQFITCLPGALVAAMGISLILGMGMPATAVYLILATLVAPSLIRLGVTPLAAHMFVFYFGIVSTITPPVALTAYAAAAVGGGDGVRVGFKAFGLGLAAYSIPFVLVYAPELMFTGTVFQALVRFAVSIAAVYAIALAGVGFIRMPLSTPCRVLAALAGLFLMTPNFTSDLIGFALLGLVLFMHHLRRPN